ncbi:MAG: AI-2E family transporter [Bacteroidia bacterium]|nr:AI-2E family transporter [Bacteroidia bacterium]MCF8426625.1 AI-2E family transporter [Bacteroidia bacterium]MCF8446929.1 AI-2E family transporter [Bacteroidia bacterium]
MKSNSVIKGSVYLVGILALLTLLYLARDIIIPIVFSILLSILLDPIVSFLKKYRIPTIWAISITLLLLIILSTFSILLLISQLSGLLDELPKLIQNITTLLVQTEKWFAESFDLKLRVIQTWVKDANADLVNESRTLIGSTIMGIGSVLVILVLIPVYVFMILYYKRLLLYFLYNVFGENEKDRVYQLLISMKSVVQNYLLGLFIETVLVAILNSIGLLILGLEYAILIGILGALLNIIPYLGGLVAVTLPVIIALATQSTSTALWVIVIYGVIQFIDNNIIMTKIVASKVQINGLISVAIVIAGGALWGVSGMFLSIPLAALLKVYFDQSKYLKPFGFLLGTRQSI